MWKELEERYSQSTPLPVARRPFFQCRQRPGVPSFDYQLNLRELHSRWRKQEPSGEAGYDTLLRDQFLLGLDDGPVKQELQRQVRRQDSLTFHQVTMEARALERELWGEGPASQTPAASLEPPVRPEVDLEQWKEDVKRELCQELQDKLTDLGRTLLAELKQQCAPGALRPRELIITICMLPFQISTPSRIGGTSMHSPSVMSVEMKVEVGGRQFPCLLDTGSQVTLFSEGYYWQWLGDRPMQNPAILEWLNLRAANGLQIPFIVYAVMDFKIRGVHVPALLGEVIRGAQPGALTFVAIQQGKARREWERAFAVCYRLQNWPPVLEQLGSVRLTRRDSVQVLARSEVVRWA
ncbi:hypothetical protein SKAU_G00234340 [Synaphobranchus kaupii]|uniref:Uncharacterized protein n=1 Tax=Synaphobranchus kaupii TaxID=118154 RepID=A0A9Q1F6E2_SYNKA|nr:hypothetical protein SKAU_G00234340 [Synaphobranchus kaupii]